MAAVKNAGKTIGLKVCVGHNTLILAPLDDGRRYPQLTPDDVDMMTVAELKEALSNAGLLTSGTASN